MVPPGAPRWSQIILIAGVLLGTGCGGEPATGMREVSIQIISPANGSVLRRSDPKGLQLHVHILGMEVPSEGHGVLFLDGQLVASMPENEVFFEVEGISSLKQGEHTLTVRLHDENDVPLGAEQYSVFQVEGDDTSTPPEAPNVKQSPPSFGAPGRAPSWGGGVDPRRPSSCVMDPSKTTAQGDGLSAVSAGMSSEFAIHPRDSNGNLIDPRDCPDPLSLLVVIKPAPFEHKMSRGEDGLYYCMWVAEYAGDVQIDVQLRGASDIHIQGSPFMVRVHQMYTVEVHRPIRPPTSDFNGHHLHTSRDPRHHLPSLGEPLVPGGDAEGVKKACGHGGGCAFVSMVSSDAYLAGVLTLLFSIRKTGTNYPFVAMVPTGTLSHASLASLEAAGMTIHEVKGMKKQDISDMSEVRWNENYSKLRLWQLPYHKIIFLDSDMIVLQPLDHLFALQAEFAAVPDAFHPCYLNTGFMVISPNNASFYAMAALIDEVSSEESEQTLVNHWYLDRYHVLHYTYNFAKHNVMSPTRFQIYVERYMDTVKVIHYLGVKPWQCSRDRDCMRHVPYYGGPSNMYLYDLWWNMFDELCDHPGVACIAQGE